MSKNREEYQAIVKADVHLPNFIVTDRTPLRHCRSCTFSGCISAISSFDKRAMLSTLCRGVNWFTASKTAGVARFKGFVLFTIYIFKHANVRKLGLRSAKTVNLSIWKTKEFGTLEIVFSLGIPTECLSLYLSFGQAAESRYLRRAPFFYESRRRNLRRTCPPQITSLLKSYL